MLPRVRRCMRNGATKLHILSHFFPNMNRYYTVLDTNILVSGMLKVKSIPAQLLQLHEKNYLIPVFSKTILEEYKSVLSRSKFSFSAEKVQKLLDGIVEKGIEIHTFQQEWSRPDASDAVFFEVVMEHRKTEEQSYLVTGNLRHFPVKHFVVTPREMLMIVANDLLHEHWLWHFLHRAGRCLP